MIGKITKIDPVKVSRNSGQAFIRVYFDLKRGQNDIIWAKTDIVPTFKNYARWKPLLKVGNVLDGLQLFGRDSVNADSKPVLIKQVEENVNEKPELSTKLTGEDLQRKLL